MLRTKASTYAILAVGEIAKRQAVRPDGVQAGEIARCLNLPAAYAAKVLTQLARAGILRSDRGPRGGFRLLKPPEEIHLLEIVEAVDGTIGAQVELEAVEEAGGRIRSVDQVFDEIVDHVRGILRKETIADLIREESSRSLLESGAPS
jgi:Rrf2 family protein